MGRAYGAASPAYRVLINSAFRDVGDELGTRAKIQRPGLDVRTATLEVCHISYCAPGAIDLSMGKRREGEEEGGCIVLIDGDASW